MLFFIIVVDYTQQCEFTATNFVEPQSTAGDALTYLPNLKPQRKVHVTDDDNFRRSSYIFHFLQLCGLTRLSLAVLDLVLDGRSVGWSVSGKLTKDQGKKNRKIIKLVTTYIQKLRVQIDVDNWVNNVLVSRFISSLPSSSLLLFSLSSTLLLHSTLNFFILRDEMLCKLISRLRLRFNISRIRLIVALIMHNKIHFIASITVILQT